MTEKMKNTEFRKIHWRGFVTSLIAAPVLISSAILGPLAALDWVYDTHDTRAVFAVMTMLSVIGAQLYFVIGTPVLIWHLHRTAPDIRRIALLSVASLLWIIPLGAVFSLMTLSAGPFFFAALSMCFGLIGGPPLAALFTVIYKRFDRA